MLSLVRRQRQKRAAEVCGRATSGDAEDRRTREEVVESWEEGEFVSEDLERI